MKPIALVPLDSRPCCRSFPESIAAIGGFRLLTPAVERLGRFMTPGDCSAVRDWLREAASQADGIVVAADQLAYGGLIASRTCERSFEQAMETLDVLREIKERYPSKPIYVSSVLMRITVTGKNALFAKYWKLVADYARLYDRVHRLQESGLEEELARVHSQIPQKVLEDFFRARERNKLVHLKLIEWAGAGVIDYLAITQEDASPVGVHIPEQHELQRAMYEQRAQAKTILYPGADEAAQTLLARMMQTLSGRRVKVYPRFSSEAGKLTIPAFEDRPVEETVRAHLWSAGAIVVGAAQEADLILSVNPPVSGKPDGGQEPHGLKACFDSRHMLTDLVESARYDMLQGRRVAVADVAMPNASDVELVRYLLDERLFTGLTAYAGWNTAGNTLGTCIAHAVARTLQTMSASFSNNTEAVTEHYSFLLSRLMDEWGYQAQARGEVNGWISAQGLSGSPWDLESDYDRVNSKAAEIVRQLFDKTKPQLLGPVFPAAGGAGGAIVGAELDTVRLSWNRTFEAEVRVRVSLADDGDPTTV